MKDWEKYVKSFDRMKERDEIYARVENKYRDACKSLIYEYEEVNDKQSHFDQARQIIDSWPKWKRNIN